MGGPEADGSGSYSLLDNNPVQGQNIYRLKREDLNSTISYSNLVTVAYADLIRELVSGNISIFPNPVTNTLHLSIFNTQGNSNSYRIKISNSSGLVIKKFVSPQPSWQGNAADLRAGTYFIDVFDNKDHSIIGRSKFVKL